MQLLGQLLLVAALDSETSLADDDGLREVPAVVEVVQAWQHGAGGVSDCSQTCSAVRPLTLVERVVHEEVPVRARDFADGLAILVRRLLDADGPFIAVLVAAIDVLGVDRGVNLRVCGRDERVERKQSANSGPSCRQALTS